MVCILCDQQDETMHNLLVGCVVSRSVWHDVFHWCRLTAQPPDSTTEFFEWWSSSISASPASHRRGLRSLIVLTAWITWKHRNACLFDGATPSYTHLLRNIQEEARTCARAGARGLSITLVIGAEQPLHPLLNGILVSAFQ
ncbi:hypothetical protein D1007_15725 [Hordeum vulgare]|nr:hypothetical protein D1007_15725 [Hordeum vulgare]